MSEQIQYIGARYVIKIYENKSDPSTAEWDSNTFYEPLTMVTFEYNSYLSKKAVPATVGNPAANSEYWAQTGYYSGQIAELYSHVSDLESNLNSEITARENADSSLGTRIDYLTSSVNSSVSNLVEKDAELTTAIANEVSARSGADDTLQDNIDSAVTTLNQSISEEATARANADTTINARIDQIIAPSGEAPSEAEVLDARIGANGVTYSSLGNAIRSQISIDESMIKENTSLFSDAISYDPYNLFIESDFEAGSITSTGVEENSSTIYRNASYLRLPTNAEYLIVNKQYFVAIYDQSKNFIIRLNNNANNAVELPNGAFYYRFVLTNSVMEDADNIIALASNVAPVANVAYAKHYTIGDNVTVPQDANDDNLFIVNDFESGAIIGTGADEANPNTVRNHSYLKLLPFKQITTNSFVWIAFYNEGKQFIERATVNSGVTVDIPNGAYYYRCCLTKTAYDSYKNDISVRYGTKAKKEHNCNIVGRNVWTYKYGDNGVDWCFVRTPSNYDPNRAKPYPFVICNHGNGWVMDGTPQKANWTDYSMYVPVGESETGKYQTETSDDTLYYSNPTIEALLTEGFVVCGAQNYGDNLYGNENCRTACVNFFNHMKNNYNVTDYCCMIGMSNGSLTSINASYYLQGKVHAMVLQAPLTCLVNQYFATPSHQAPIRAAYGIDNTDPTEAEMIEYTKTHDVLHTNIAANTRCDMFPPVKLYYATDDDLVKPSANSIPLKQMLLYSNKICEDSVFTGGHGSSHNFDPEGFVTFLTKFID